MTKSVLLLFIMILSLYATFDTTVQLSSDELRTLLWSHNLNVEKETPRTDIMEKYLSMYGFPTSVFHSFGYIYSERDSIAVHYFKPQKPQGTIIAVHGYLDHSGILSSVAHWAIENNFAILLPDMPGHGLSSGKRGSVRNFHHYSTMIDSIITQTEGKVISPIHVIGHSTGCTPFLELLADHKKPWDGETILVAPLVRSALWHLSKVGYTIVSPFTKKTMRLYRNCSHNKHFLRFLKKEPLRIKNFPVQWSRAFYQWNKEIEQADFPDYPVTVIQGTKDATVDWKFNVTFLQKEIPSLKLYKITKGKHHLLNESALYQQQTFAIIEEVLTSSSLYVKEAQP